MFYNSYFRPPRGAKRQPTRKWTDAEKDLLIEGIEKYGIGNFGEVSKELLPKWVSFTYIYIYIQDVLLIANLPFLDNQ